MNESLTATTNHFSPAAHLPAIGVKLTQLDLFGPIRTQVHSEQQTVKHTPADKLSDAWISRLSGAHGLVEITTRLRTDPGLQRAFGRAACAEQAVVQATLAACTAENVPQLQQALDELFRQHSQSLHHDYQASFHLLDVDRSAMPCGPKAYAGPRIGPLAGTVTRWVQDPAWPERSFGWVSEPATGNVRPVQRIAVRCRRLDGTFADGVLLCSLSVEQVLTVLGRPKSQAADPVAVLLAYVTFYDLRGGGIETSLKGDKQGLGLTKRNQKRFEAQQMLVVLGALAHHVVVWARRWLNSPPIQRCGILRLVRDVFPMSGLLRFEALHHAVKIVLNQDARLARLLLSPLQELLTPLHIVVTLGET